MEYLERRYYKKEGGNKYHIDCNELSTNADNIEIEDIIRYKNNISVLKGIIKNIKNNTIPNLKNTRHIVAKIGYSNKTLEKEWQIGNMLTGIPGYINYICLFECFDDSYKKEKPTRICDAEKKPENNKKVLLMPYINEGSIKSFNWTVDKLDILRSVVIQSIMSALVAYQKIGFIHGDFHLDNILLKKTKKTHIEYTLETDKCVKVIKIPSNGYKIVIMDFENSWIVDKHKGLYTYWNNLYNMISRLKWDLYDNKKYNINIRNLSNILTFIETQMNDKNSNQNNYMNTTIIIKQINQLEIELIKQPEQQLTYNPNIF